MYNGLLGSHFAQAQFNLHFHFFKMFAKNAGILVQTVHFSGNLLNESKIQDGAAASSLANDEADAVYPLYPPDEITVF